MNDKTLNKINRITGFVLRLALFLAIFIEIYFQRWLMLFVTVITLVLTFLPMFFEKKFNIDIPNDFELMIIFFIFLALYLGEVHNFYILFWWWDIFLHGLSAIALGLIGFIIVLYLSERKKVEAQPFLLCLFAFCFALAAGTIWEIFEFAMDQTFGLNMQKSGIVDTMSDLIIDSVGALLASFSGYLYLKNKRSKLTHSIHSFVKNNPKLFKK